MKSTRTSGLLVALSFILLVFGAGTLRAQTLQLSINPQTITFPAADPDSSPQVAADRPVQVTIRATGMGGRSWQLTLRANGNLNDFWSLASIDISNVSWTATPIPPFRIGTRADNVEQIAASRDGSYNNRGDLNFVFQNQWSYWAGQYSQTVAFTLSAI
jgi:hypothetical protein